MPLVFRASVWWFDTGDLSRRNFDGLQQCERGVGLGVRDMLVCRLHTDVLDRWKLLGRSAAAYPLGRKRLDILECYGCFVRCRCDRIPVRHTITQAASLTMCVIEIHRRHDL